MMKLAAITLTLLMLPGGDPTFVTAEAAPEEPFPLWGVATESERLTGAQKRALENTRHSRDVPERHLGATLSPFHFRAYDCAKPKNIRRVTAPQPDACRFDAQLKHEEYVEMTVLQTAPVRKYSAKRCRWRYTTMPGQCTNNDATVPLNEKAEFYRMGNLGKERCTEAWEKKRFVFHKTGEDYGRPGRRIFNLALELNATNYLFYEEVGQTAYEPHNAQTNDAHCYGDTWFHQDYRSTKYNLHYMVVPVWAELELLQIEVSQSSDGALVDMVAGSPLPCSLDEDPMSTRTHCATADADYLIETPKDARDCDVFKTREVQGQVLAKTHSDLQTKRNAAFVSTDGSMIRLLLMGQTTKCGHIVTRTDYPEIFVVQREKTPAVLQRMLPAQLVSPTLFTQLADQHLQGDHRTRLHAEVVAVYEAACRRRLAPSYVNPTSRQLARRTGCVLTDGWGNYTKFAGRLEYQFQCHPVLVRGLSAKSCYTTLPVYVEDEFAVDMAGRRNVSLQEFRNITFFLDPLTLELTTYGVPAECQGILGDGYVTVQDINVIVTPELIPLAPAEVLPLSLFRDDPVYEPRYQSRAKAGLYTEETLRAFYTAMTAGKRKEQWTTVAEATSNLPPQLTYDDPQGPGATGLWSALIIPSFVTSILRWCERHTTLISVASAVGVVYLLIKRTATTTAAVRATAGVNCCVRMVMICFPTVAILWGITKKVGAKIKDVALPSPTHEKTPEKSKDDQVKEGSKKPKAPPRPPPPTFAELNKDLEGVTNPPPFETLQKKAQPVKKDVKPDAPRLPTVAEEREGLPLMPAVPLSQYHKASSTLDLSKV